MHKISPNLRTNEERVSKIVGRKRDVGNFALVNRPRREKHK